MATVLITGTRPMLRHNMPWPSRHTLVNETKQPLRFVPRRLLERAWRPLAALSWPHRRGAPYDLIHGMNAIPLTTKPWVATFESMMPRAIGPGGTRLALTLRDHLARDNCRALLAMSAYARRKFTKAHRDWPLLDRVLPKVQVVYPHFVAREATVRRLGRGEPLRVVFVGNDFARKGGIVALRAVAKATKRGLPVHLDIASGMQLAGDVYTDHPDPRRYAPDLRLLLEPQVTVHGRLPNADVLALLAGAHVHTLATMDDTFGNSVVEAASVGTPSIVTNVCAMPELVGPDNGAVLNLPVDEWGNWVGLPRRHEPDFWELLDATYESLADQVVERWCALADAPEQLSAWSEAGLARFRRNHESKMVSAKIDDLYDAALT